MAARTVAIRTMICAAVLACGGHGAVSAQVQGSNVASPPGPAATDPGLADQARIDRARRNHQALREGRKQISDLSQQDLADVDALDRYARGQTPDTRSLSQRCVDEELRRAGDSPSQLERRAIDVKCREAGD